MSVHAAPRDPPRATARFAVLLDLHLDWDGTRHRADRFGPVATVARFDTDTENPAIAPAFAAVLEVEVAVAVAAYGVLGRATEGDRAHDSTGSYVAAKMSGLHG